MFPQFWIRCRIFGYVAECQDVINLDTWYPSLWVHLRNKEFDVFHANTGTQPWIHRINNSPSARIVLVCNYCWQGYTGVVKEYFLKLLGETREKAFTKGNISAVWRGTGLALHNPTVALKLLSL